MNVRIETGQALARGFGFGLADVLGAERNLALQIGDINDIKVHKAEPANARCRKVQTQRRAQAAGPNQQHFGILELQLTFHADFGHDQVTAVTQNLFV